MSSNTFTDDRGTITDLLVTPECSVTHITFTTGAVRGNHYHEYTEQQDFVVKGLLVSSVDGVEEALYKGDCMKIAPNKKHAYKALEDSEIISICFGVRKGEDYEKDVIRIEGDEKLL